MFAEHRNHFEMVRGAGYVQLTASTLPIEVIMEQHLLLTIRATKPRSVDATATISITLPEGKTCTGYARIIYIIGCKEHGYL